MSNYIVVLQTCDQMFGLIMCTRLSQTGNKNSLAAGDKGHQLELKATVQPTINICCNPPHRAVLLHECKHSDNNDLSSMSEGIKLTGDNT